MSVQLMNASHIEEIEMNEPKESSESSNNSSCSLESGKDPPQKDNDMRISRETNFSYNICTSDTNIFRNSASPLVDSLRNLAREMPVPSYSEQYIRNTEVKEISPTNSLFNIDATIEINLENKQKLVKKNMIGIYSCIYGMLLTIIGGVIYVSHQTQERRYISELFSTFIAGIGMLWLIFLHFDLSRYKSYVLENILAGTEQIDKTSMSEYNPVTSFIGNETPPYRFLRGRHSGSFYLKVGLAAFCFGHLINEGLLLGQEIINYMQEERRELKCGDPYSTFHHIIRPLYSFYQLFIVFKYSNIIINRYKGLACFALMHIMATCLCFWFGTIVEDALEDYYHKLGQKQNMNATLHYSENSLFYHESTETLEDSEDMVLYHGTTVTDYLICSPQSNSSACLCSRSAILSVNNVQAIPYLYPFTIEFNILLAGVWFIVWHNIGKKDHRANPHHFHHKVNTSDSGEELTYQSNLVISADCHASNKGLFAGMFILMTAIISIIIFFVAYSLETYEEFALSIHYVQEGTLNILTLVGVLIAYKKLSELDYNLHPTHFLDDLLLFVPLPFFFMQAVLVIISEFQKGSVIRLFMSVLVPVQVILQTPLIIDGLRRCSNSQSLRYKKPGREIVTFLIVCNLTMWIINTFEAKSVESSYGQRAYFGKFVWMFLSHTTLPLMLFYRFHSSACLADIWKTAYDKGE